MRSKSRLRVAGGIIAGFGIALGGVAALSMAGAFPVSIAFFGFDVNTRAERFAWIGAWSLVAVIGLVLSVATRHGRGQSTE
jgi:high-affinity Fe2+/Pb2+ permease